MNKRRIMILISILMFACSLCIAAYPLIANYVDEKHQSTVRANFESNIEKIDRTDRTIIQKIRSDAERYNAAIAPVQFSREGVEAASAEYRKLLDPSGSGIMGYIEIPKIHINLPIYHGTAETVLQEGVGHLLGSSLPIGGTGCHSILTGHSGVAGKRLFSDLDQLALGDCFYLHILGDTLAYEVEAINIVLPHETELLELVHGQDLCTLVTCTPFGVNSHRLLVRGVRVPYVDAVEIEQKTAAEAVPSRSTWTEQYYLGLEIGGGLALGAALVFFVFMQVRQRRRKEK